MLIWSYHLDPLTPTQSCSVIWRRCTWAEPSKTKCIALFVCGSWPHYCFLIYSSTPQLQQVETARPVTPIENMHTPTTQFLPHAFQATPFSFTPAPVTMETNTTTAADTVTTNTINSIPSISAHHQEDSSKVKEKPQILHTTVYTRWVAHCYQLTLQLLMVLHRYLQGLRSNKQHFSNWHDSQTVQQCGMAQAPASLQPAKWISPKAVPNNKNITDALYQLRDHLLQDSAKLSKYLSSHWHVHHQL